MRSEMLALIKKDWTAFTANKRLLLPLYLVPVIFTVFFPTIFILAFHFAPEELSELQPLLDKLPAAGYSLAPGYAFVISGYFSDRHYADRPFFR